MNLEQFIENFTDLFDETEPDAIEATTQFKDLEEWSSLLALSIIAMVDDEYDMIIKGNDIVNSETIQDLYNVIAAKQ